MDCRCILLVGGLAGLIVSCCRWAYVYPLKHMEALDFPALNCNSSRRRKRKTKCLATRCCRSRKLTRQVVYFSEFLSVRIYVSTLSCKYKTRWARVTDECFYSLEVFVTWSGGHDFVVFLPPDYVKSSAPADGPHNCSWARDHFICT